MLQPDGDCCKHPKVESLMNRRFVLSEEGRYVEKPYGEPGQEKFYTRKEWDAWMESA